MKDDDGNVIGQRRTYDTFSDYTFNEETKKYEGVNKTGSYSATLYTGSGAREYYQELLRKS